MVPSALTASGPLVHPCQLRLLQKASNCGRLVVESLLLSSCIRMNAHLWLDLYATDLKQSCALSHALNSLTIMQARRPVTS